MAGPLQASNPTPVEIYFAPGVDPGKKTSSFVYRKIYNGTIFGAGTNNVTSLPELENAVVIPAGASYSFYITVAKFSLGYIQCTKVLSEGDVAASTEYVEVLDGYFMGHPFLYYNPGYRWNGKQLIIKVILSNRIIKFTCLVIHLHILQATCTIRSRPPSRRNHQRVVSPRCQR